MSDDIFILLGQALFAVVGASIRWINTTDNPKTIKDFLIDAASAAFFGMVIGCLAEAMYLSNKLGFALAGIAGYGGVPLFELALKRIIHRYFPEDATQPIEPIPEENTSQDMTT